jgi:transposase
MHAGARYGNLTKDATASVVDGYPGFERLRANHIQLAACWAHAWRKFYEVHQATGSPIAAEALRRIADLYAIETTIWGRQPINGRACGEPSHCRLSKR